MCCFGLRLALSAPASSALNSLRQLKHIAEDDNYSQRAWKVKLLHVRVTKTYLCGHYCTDRPLLLGRVKRGFTPKLTYN